MQDGAKKIAKEKVKVIKKLNSKDSNIKRTLAVSNEYKPDHPSRKIGGLQPSSSTSNNGGPNNNKVSSLMNENSLKKNKLKNIKTKLFSKKDQRLGSTERAALPYTHSRQQSVKSRQSAGDGDGEVEVLDVDLENELMKIKPQQSRKPAEVLPETNTDIGVATTTRGHNIANV